MEDTTIPFLSGSNKLIGVIVEPRYRWLRHVLLLLLLVVSYNSMLVTFIGNLGLLGGKVIYLAVAQFAIYVAMAYFNIYVLMPRLFMKSRYVAYCFTLLATLTVVFIFGYTGELLISRAYSFEPGLLSYVNSEHNLAIDYLSDIAVTGMCCAGTSITMLFRKWLTEGKRRQEMESMQLLSNIEKVKTSVKSGFLSQALEAAASKTTTDSVLAIDIISRLGRFLRYRLYDSNRRVVMLNSEVAFLDNYLALVVKIRGNFTYRLTYDPKMGRYTVSPSVLITVTDIILDQMPRRGPGRLEIHLDTDGEDNIIVKFTARCPSIPGSVGKITDELRGIFGTATAPAGILSVIRHDNTYAVTLRLDTGR